MNWHPTKGQLEIITDAATARIPIAALARQLGVDEAVLVAWARRVAAARELASSERTDDWDSRIARFPRRLEYRCNYWFKWRASRKAAEQARSAVSILSARRLAPALRFSLSLQRWISKCSRNVTLPRTVLHMRPRRPRSN
jgi:hypothetical protein